MPELVKEENVMDFPAVPELIIGAYNIKRFHTSITHQTQTVGHHTANMIGLLLTTGWDPTAELITAIAIHDLPESFTGDIPAPFKRSMTGMKSVEDQWFARAEIKQPMLSPAEDWLLHWVDMVDGLIFCQIELRLGNQFMQGVYNNYRALLAEHMNLEARKLLPDRVAGRIDSMTDKFTQ